MRNKQKVFIQEYLKDFNALQAAVRAGYSKKTAGSIGAENLKKPEIKEAIELAIEQRSMGESEVLLRLGQIARGDMGDFMDISSMHFELDLNQAKELGITHLIKKVRQKTVTIVDKNGEESETSTIEIELYSSQEALEWIGKHLHLFDARSELKVDGTMLWDWELPKESNL